MNKQLTLIYFQKNNQTLFLLRNQKTPDEISVGKYIGVGGKVDPSDNTIEDAAIRECLEETNLQCISLEKKGIVYFIGQKPYTLETHIFICKDFKGNMKADEREGSLHWIDNDQILNLNLWEGDKIFLNKLFQDSFFEIELYYNLNKELIDIKFIK